MLCPPISVFSFVILDLLLHCVFDVLGTDNLSFPVHWCLDQKKYSWTWWRGKSIIRKALRWMEQKDKMLACLWGLVHQICGGQINIFVDEKVRQAMPRLLSLLPLSEIEFLQTGLGDADLQVSLYTVPRNGGGRKSGKKKSNCYEFTTKDSVIPQETLNWEGPSQLPWLWQAGQVLTGHTDHSQEV